jgi:hypothetical protein
VLKLCINPENEWELGFSNLKEYAYFNCLTIRICKKKNENILEILSRLIG